jgi:hypothetical protein
MSHRHPASLTFLREVFLDLRPPSFPTPLALWVWGLGVGGCTYISEGLIVSLRTPSLGSICSPSICPTQKCLLWSIFREPGNARPVRPQH